MNPERKQQRRRTILVSRSIIVLVLAGSLGSLFWTPPNVWLYALDVLARTYLAFLGTVMAHEGVHGHLGSTRRSNFEWGRLALIPSLVPFTNFRRTHHLHHAHTNEPDRDPDYFMKPGGVIEIPFRALAMPHQWYFWLKRRNLLDRNHCRDLIGNYVTIATVFGILSVLVGPARVLLGVGPTLILVSVLLWYPFALKTHEGHSVGASETRSHDYYGHLMYWLSLGLSVHRVHHEKPQLSWIELKAHVRPAPQGSLGGLIPRRDVRLAGRVHAFLIIAVLASLASCLTPPPVAAQFAWRAVSTPGYAVGGVAASAVPAFAASSIESGVTVFAVGLAGGAITGWIIGHSAEGRLARGESLSGGHKTALRAGTVMLGAGAGALASVAVINSEGSGGNDEAIFGSFVAIGAGLGVVTQILLESRLEPSTVEVGLAPGPDGRTRLAVRASL